MVLFYREQRSTSAVAADLEISEENVRQRLARGRAMLSERMAKFVEETLERSAPTTTFAGMVLIALDMNPATTEGAVVRVGVGAVADGRGCARRVCPGGLTTVPAGLQNAGGSFVCGGDGMEGEH